MEWSSGNVYQAQSRRFFRRQRPRGYSVIDATPSKARDSEETLCLECCSNVVPIGRALWSSVRDRGTLLQIRKKMKGKVKHFLEKVKT